MKDFEAINIGSGAGTSVLELVKAFELISGVGIKVSVAPRRNGDLPAFYADPTQALNRLGWRTTRPINDMCRDMWEWQKNNPNGFSIIAL